MDVLTSPVSSLLLPPNLRLLKSPLSSSFPNLSSSSSSKPNPPFSLSSSKPLSLLSASPNLPRPPTRRSRHRAAAGYAAALIDFSKRDGDKALADVARDVRRLARSVASIVAESSMAEEERAEAVREAVESGGFDRRLVALVRMVGAKKKGAEEVAEVLGEFGRIWGEMSSAAVEVVVASEKKMGIEQIVEIARKVQRMCGAVKVNVKHFFQQRSPRFGV